MHWKNAGLVAVGVVVGYIAATILHSDRKVAGGAGDSAAPLRHDQPSKDTGTKDLESKVAKVAKEPDATRTQPSPPAEDPAPVQTTSDDRRTEVARKFYAQALQRETEQLLALGFSNDRIKW